MNDSRSPAAAASNRTSGIPRPLSRLPVPKSSIPAPKPSPSATARPQPPAEPSRGRLAQSTTTTNLRNPRLRPKPSREQLNVSSNLHKTPRSNAPPVSSQTSLRDLSARSRSTSREPQKSGIHSRPNSNDDSFKRPLRKRPSGQLAQAPQSIPPTQEDPSPIDEDEDAATLPPLTTSAEEGLTFDTLSAQPRKPRPSLTERTMETLAQLPSSPAVKRRGSNFFDSEASRRPQSKGSIGSRPGSSYQSDGSNGRSARSLSRPGSSSGQPDNHYANFRASTNTHMTQLSTVQGTPSRRTPAANTSKTPVGRSTPKFTPRSSLNKMPSRTSLSASVGPRTPSPEKRPETSVSKYGSKTVAARSLKPRASMNNLFKKPSMSSLDKPLPISNVPTGPPRKASLASAKSSSTSGDGRNPSSASTVSTAPTVESVDDSSASTARKSSAALREQIAKAKAAKRAVSQQMSGSKVSEADETPVIPTDSTFDFGLSDDPFGQHKFETSNRKVMQSRIDTARTTGRLNVAAMGLKQIPEEVLKMYDLDSIGRSDGTWAESVDLTRFVAANNELETIDDAIFPDVDPNDFAPDEDDRGQIFGGLESLDLRNNTLISLPMGLRRLELLTSLNLTSNKLTNNCLGTISQINTLRDLKLAGNLLYGGMEDCSINWPNLEILDLHGNSISRLPRGLDQCSRLRILNLSENEFDSLPFDMLSRLPLTELLAHKNKLTGTLIEPGVDGLAQLQILDVTSNQLQFLYSSNTSHPLNMRALHQLSISMNRIKALPDVSMFKSLLTLNAEENSITAFPEGFTSLETLRHADLSNNDLRVIPPEIARMDNLAMLRITGNPLRDKKFTSIGTEELKDALAARLEPLPSDSGGVEQFGNGFDPVVTSPSAARHSNTTIKSEAVDDDGDEDDERSDYDDFATPPTSAPQSPAARSRSHTLTSQTWPIKPGGVLDRANTQSSSLHPVVCSKIAVAHTVREIRLEHNTFTQFPNSLSFFTDTVTSLSMSHNQLTGESWLTEKLDLTALRELNLATNFCTSLAPLTENLCAPNLEKLDVSCNRIVRVPMLRDFFPSLTVLLISNNRLEELGPDSIQGLKTVDASNNEIAHLNPRLGLLGLDRLDVMGNRFRVPRWNVLERGTEATLRWLRGRVPVAEMAEWRKKAGEGEEDDLNEVD